MGISSMHNGKKIKPSPTVTMSHRVPSENATGVGMPGAYVALAQWLIPEGVKSATARDWQRGWGLGGLLVL